MEYIELAIYTTTTTEWVQDRKTKEQKTRKVYPMQGFEDLKHPHHRHNSIAAVQSVLVHCLIGYFVDDVCMPYAIPPWLSSTGTFLPRARQSESKDEAQCHLIFFTFFDLVQTVWLLFSVSLLRLFSSGRYHSWIFDVTIHASNVPFLTVPYHTVPYCTMSKGGDPAGKPH